MGKSLTKNKIAFNNEDATDLSRVHASFTFNPELNSYMIRDEKSSQVRIVLSPIYNTEKRKIKKKGREKLSNDFFFFFFFNKKIFS